MDLTRDPPENFPDQPALGLDHLVDDISDQMLTNEFCRLKRSVEAKLFWRVEKDTMLHQLDVRLFILGENKVHGSL